MGTYGLWGEAPALRLRNRNSFFRKMIELSRESIRDISFSAHVRAGERGAPVLFYAALFG